MINATMTKFGYPRTLIHEGEHWAVLVRPAQVTLGSLILVSKSVATSYSDLPAAAFAEQHDMIVAIERSLRKCVHFERINYLMLMMVDPHVHFHVIPRYEGSRQLGSLSFADKGWPGQPDLGSAVALRDEAVTELAEMIRSAMQSE